MGDTVLDLVSEGQTVPEPEQGWASVESTSLPAPYRHYLAERSRSKSSVTPDNSGPNTTGLVNE